MRRRSHNLFQPRINRRIQTVTANDISLQSSQGCIFQDFNSTLVQVRVELLSHVGVFIQEVGDESVEFVFFVDPRLRHHFRVLVVAVLQQLFSVDASARREAVEDGASEAEDEIDGEIVGESGMEVEVETADDGAADTERPVVERVGLEAASDRGVRAEKVLFTVHQNIVDVQERVAAPNVDQSLSFMFRKMKLILKNIKNLFVGKLEMMLVSIIIVVVIVIIIIIMSSCNSRSRRSDWSDRLRMISTTSSNITHTVVTSRIRNRDGNTRHCSIGRTQCSRTGGIASSSGSGRGRLGIVVVELRSGTSVVSASSVGATEAGVSLLIGVGVFEEGFFDDINRGRVNQGLEFLAKFRALDDVDAQRQDEVKNVGEVIAHQDDVLAVDT